MNNRVAALVALLCVWVCGAAFAEDADIGPATDLPVFPGGQPTLEINLTSENLLTALDTALALSGGRITLPDGLTSQDLAGVFADVRRIQALQVEVDKPEVTEADVAAFYAGNLPDGKWSRVFWQSGGPKGTVALYMRDNGDGIYGLRVDTARNGDSQVRRALVVSTEGRIDLVKLVAIVVRVFSAGQA